MLRAGARFCSPRCRVAHHRSGGIPQAMRNRARWVRRDARKRPLRAADGRLASVTTPGDWTGFREAQAAGYGVGLGYVLGDGIGCWDLDHCISGGTLEPWAAELLAGVPDPLFVEVSQSGTGLHIFVNAPEGPGRRTRANGQAVEFYSTGRFIALTGNHWKG